MGKFGMEPWHNQPVSLPPVTDTLPYVVSSRVRLARNLAAHRFPGLASDDERRAVVAQMQRVAASHPAFRNARLVLLDDCSPLERMRLAERHVISRHLATQGTHRAAILFERPPASILINEEDHLRIQAFSRGLHLQRAWNAAKFLAQSCEEMLDFAQSETYRYLTTSPENSGSGLRASAMLFVPALIVSKRIEALIAACISAGYTVRGGEGEGSASAGFLIQVSCQRPQERDERRILREMTWLSLSLAAQEQRARQMLLTRRPQLIQKRLAWAGHHLHTAHSLDCELGSAILGWCRFGVTAGVPIPHCVNMTTKRLQYRWLRTLDALQMHIQPAHIRQYCQEHVQDIAENSEDAKERSAHENSVRAALMRAVICAA